MNPYSVLGINSNASKDEIKKAYHKLAKQHHPDLGGDADKFKEITSAYEALTQPKQSQERDPFRNAQWKPFDEFARGFHWKGSDPKSREFFYTRMSPVMIRVDVTLKELYSNCTKYVTFKTRRGEDKVVQLDIPATANHADRILYQGLGDDSTGHPGDLIAIINLDSGKFLKANLNLATIIQLSCLKAIVGGEEEIELPDGKRVSLKIPPGTQSNSVLRLKGLGIPSPAGSGNLEVKIQTIIPRIEDDELLEELRILTRKIDE